jgi:puromycin-sensitive aminopeptidase
VKIRLITTKGKAPLGDLVLEAAAAHTRLLGEYFDRPYPYSKLDLVAVPEFGFGAMENAGLISFREELILLDAKHAGAVARRAMATNVAHEISHHWFGNLVTMAWWDDLWLNEAFATWMAYKVVDDWRPEWRMWQGYEHDRAGALGLDALANTHPIYASVRSVAQATENFDAITYEKGAAVVRMIEHYLGADAFRDGVRIYMQRHREGNAVAADLWRALEETSGREVTRVARAWIEKPGFPLVRLARRDGSLVVRQERFFADPRIPSAKRRTRWPVPLVVKHPVGGRMEVERFLVDAASTRIRFEGGGKTAWVFGNAGAGGFYRVEHDRTTRDGLLGRLDDLSAVERMALVGDQWALVRAGKATIESFLEVADVLGQEPDYDVLDSLAAPLGFIDDQIAEPGSATQTRTRAWIAGRFGPAFLELGWDPAPGEDDSTRLRRAALLRLVGLVAEEAGVLVEARRRFDAYIADRSSLEPNLADAVASLAARVGDEALYGRYRALVAEARTPHERRRFLLSLGSFRDPVTIRRTLESVLTNEIPTQDVAFVLMRLFANPAGRFEAWRFFRKRWKALSRRIPPLMISRLVESLPSLREPRHAREVSAFFRLHPVPEATRAVRQALEVFRLNSELRRRAAPALSRWVASKGV